MFCAWRAALADEELLSDERGDMFPDDQDAVAKRETLVGIVGDCRIECGMADGDTRSRRNYPAHVLVRAVPHFDAEGGGGSGYPEGSD